ncbi:MAG: leucine-rich repeat protein [Clostridia bacterium]|nr:leucine-rich repeat protein [Clostridia bacterium]
MIKRFFLIFFATFALSLFLVSCDDTTYYTVTFYTNCQDENFSQYVAEGALATEPDVPLHKDNYYLAGWMDSANTPWDFSTNTINNDYYLYANWQPCSYSITYVGAEYYENPTSYVYGTGTTIYNGVKDYYDFMGWFYDQELTQAFTGINSSTSGDITLYASLSYQPFKLELNVDGFYTITELLDKEAEDIVIPESYNGTRISEIGNKAFMGCNKLKSVSMGDGLRVIGSHAFNGCTSLQSVNLGNAISSIGQSAFYSCSSLRDIQIPGTILCLEPYTFWQCTSLEEVTITGSISRVGLSSFSDCKSLKKVTLSSDVKELGDFAFSGCTSLKEINLNSGLTSIGQAAFSGCNSLSAVDIGSSVVQIGAGAFRNCTNLTISCQLSGKPDGWANNWNGTCQVIWK